jgi:quinol monooxygenase YgiN
MAVIVMVEVHGQTEAGYNGMLAVLQDPIRRADGFLLHAAYLADGNWRVLEVWRSKSDADQFFADHVAPNLPPGVRPKRAVYESRSFVTPTSGV